MTDEARQRAEDRIVIRHGHVLTMDPALGDIPDGDVLVTGGRIAAVGPALDAPGARVLDARGMIVAPGLVDTHWHMWNTLLRSMSGEGPPAGYFRVSVELGRAFGPADIYQGTLLACAEAISSGITTVHDWCHNVRGPAHAEAGLRAIAESGLRARFSYGYAAGHANDQAMDLAGLRALHRDWDWPAGGGLLSLGMAWRGPGGSNPAMRVAPAIYQREIEAARSLGLPVTVHACGPRPACGQIAALAAAGLLGPDLQVVHANCATQAELTQLAEAGCAVSVSPFSELLIGYGLPRTAELLAAGIPVGLSVDTTALTGNADMFAIMKLTQGLVNGSAGDEFAMTARQALALGTISGARSLGLAGQAGSLTPGKRADIILVATGGPNLGVFTDPAQMLVAAAQPANVDTVLVNGRLLKRGGALLTLDPDAVSAGARAALARVRAQAG
ncbi:MAG TPA: amidohydrolase family protein [Streptosporangiaceae bacterium]|nr:amidohydrolase family protein [Streptosporangiaceae bacterium]